MNRVFATVLNVLASTTMSGDMPIPMIPVQGYELIWADEFEGEDLDRQKWSYRRLGPRRDGINVPESISLDGAGHLVITTRQVGSDYHTGMIGTEGKFETTFGYFETRVRLQTQVGHWSAFWLQSPFVEKVGNPRIYGTEIDIFEYHSQDHLLNRALHWNGYGIHHRKIHDRNYDPGLSEGFQVFGLEWTPEEYVFYQNGQVVWRTDQAISHRNQYIVLSLEVGRWAGDIAEADLPDSLYVDYVRVYQKPVMPISSDLKDPEEH